MYLKHIHCSVFIGLTSRDPEILETWPHHFEVEYVRIPDERLAMYQRWRNDPDASWSGPADIALFRLSREVTYIPNVVAPVSYIVTTLFSTLYSLFKRSF